MSLLFGEDFKQRVDLQRRQRYHQELLDSQRFGDGIPPTTAEEGPGVGPMSDSVTGRATKGEGRAAPWRALGVLLCFYTLPAALVSGVVALPVGFGLMLLTRRVSGYSIESFGGFYRAAWLGVFWYLTVTLAIGLLFTVAYAPHTDRGIVADFSSAFFEFGGSPGVLLVIFLPGVLACAATWSSQIERPFGGQIGYLAACALSLFLVPAAVGAILWGCVELLL